LFVTAGLKEVYQVLTDVQDQLVELATNEFAFLRERGGRRRQTEKSSTGRVIAYIFGELSFELDFDWMERHFSVLVSRTTDGKPAPGYLRHQGVHVRTYLFNLLDVGEPSEKILKERLKKANGVNGEDAIRNQVLVNADALRACIDRVLARGQTIFDETPRDGQPDASARRLP
jgi:hypothetical protein